MDRHWARMFPTICMNELCKLRIKSWYIHGKPLSKKQTERIDARMKELYPVYEKFIEEYGTEEMWLEKTDTTRERFSQYVRLWERGEKIKKLKRGIISDTP